MIHALLSFPLLADTLQQLSDKIALDSQILTEQFYYWTVS